MRLHSPLAVSIIPLVVGKFDTYIRDACIVVALKLKGKVLAPVSCTANRVESEFQTLMSALPLPEETYVRFLKVEFGLVFESVTRTIRLPKLGSVTTVFAPRRLPTLGGVSGNWAMLRSVREQP